MELGVSCALSGAAHRSGRNGGLRTQLDAVLNQFPCSFGVHHDKDHVGCLAANLKTHARCPQSEHGWRPPRAITTLAAHQDATPISTAESQSEFELRRNDANANCFVQQFIRNTFVRSSHNLVKNIGCFLQLSLTRECRRTEQEQQKNQAEFFHLRSEEHTSELQSQSN